MLLAFALVLFVAGFLCFKIDRQAAHYSREQLARPLWQLALRVTDWAKGLPWIIAALLFYLAVQTIMAWRGETTLLRSISDYSLALLASFVAASVMLHSIKIFLGRRRPRDEFEHGLYGFRFFTWELQYDSFPSGHSMTILCVAVTASAIAPILAPVWLLLATGLAVTRAMLTAHFFSDVFIGAGVGVLVAREVFLIGFPQLAPSWF
ncbi:MAG TPA: phosphatase PAP2 family protein [Micropepsaceae bacterium]|jgi:membrane-associated phospholipid phosphatase|nr:phosphatase PAP2 family protein [Micropepsaceae bacterium]